MQIEYCESCRTKLSDVEFDSGLGVWINNEPYCKGCAAKVPQATKPASRSGPRPAARATPSGTRATPSGTRATPSSTRATPSGTRSSPSHSKRRLSTPGGTAVARRSGLNRASAESRKTSGLHPRHGSSPHGQAVSVSEGPSMVMVSVVGAAIGILLAVIVIMVFF